MEKSFKLFTWNNRVGPLKNPETYLGFSLRDWEMQSGVKDSHALPYITYVPIIRGEEWIAVVPQRRAGLSKVFLIVRSDERRPMESLWDINFNLSLVHFPFKLFFFKPLQVIAALLNCQNNTLLVEKGFSASSLRD